MVKLFALVLVAVLATEKVFTRSSSNRVESLIDKARMAAQATRTSPPARKNIDVLEEYGKLMRYVPEQLGVRFDDQMDKDITTAGNSILGYGVYNQHARRNDFRRLKKQLDMGIQARHLYIQALDRETGLLKSVLDAINANIKTIQTRSATVVEEIDSAANENAF